LNDLGILALLIGIAEWGVEPSSELPRDPNGHSWKSYATEGTCKASASGKHLMSYAAGGVGIAHADTEYLRDYILFVGNSNLVPPDRRAGLLRLAAINYGPHKSGVIYNEIRNAGLCGMPCGSPSIGKDLADEPFHYSPQAITGSCAGLPAALTPADWTVFRTWMRASLRTKEGQTWLLSYWLDHYWAGSLKTVVRGNNPEPDRAGKPVPPEGYVEEALLNVRVRDSSPSLAESAVTDNTSSPQERVQRELRQYGRLNGGSTLARRCTIMLRPVALYRAFAHLPPLADVQCPNGKVSFKDQ
jgi:hypothetical protein